MQNLFTLVFKTEIVHRLCQNLDTAIASLTVIRRSNYVFKHGQCGELINSNDPGYKYSGIRPL